MVWKIRHRLAAGIALIFLAFAQAHARAALPALAYSTPSSNPALPPEMNVFAPPIDSQAIAAGAPIIASSSAAVQPDHSLTITGAQLSAATGDSAFSDTEFIVYGQTSKSNGTLTDAQIQTITPSGAILTIDPAEPPNSMYLLWPVSSQGAGAPIALNQTQAWWIGTAREIVPADPDAGGVTMSVAQTMSVFGRNLSNGAKTPKSWVYLQSTTGGQNLWANVTAAGTYRVDFTVSTPGTYQVWVNNGLGGQFGWSEVMQVGPSGQSPQLLTVTQSAPSWSNDPASIINVKNYGATGNGLLSDGEAIQKAIGALHKGSTLYFPAGNYLVSGGEQLLLPQRIRVLGDGSGKSVLVFNEPTPQSGLGGFAFGWGDHGPVDVEVDGISLDYAGPSQGGQVLRAGMGSNIVLRDVQIVANALIPLLIGNSHGVTIDHCSIQGLDVNALGATDVFIDSTNFYLAYGGIAAISFWGSHNVSITGCSIQNSDPTILKGWAGAGHSRFIEYNLDWGSIYNQYVAGNVTSLGQPILDNSGEQILCEGSLQLTYHGPAQSASAASVTLPVHKFDKYAYQPGTRVIITDGSGIGQMRGLISTTVNRDPSGAVTSVEIHLDRPWNLQPDSTSILFVGGVLSQSVFTANTLVDPLFPPKWADNARAAQGIDICGYGDVIDGNVIRNLIAGVALPASADFSQPTYYIDILNNHIEDCTSAGIWYGLSVDNFKYDPNYIGVSMHDNALINAPAGVNPAWQRMGSGVLTLIEHNTISAPRGIWVYCDPLTLARKNNFIAPPLGPGTQFYPQAIVYAQIPPPAAHTFNPTGRPEILLRDNDYRDYAARNKYFSLAPDVGLPPPVLIAPFHVIRAIVKFGATAPVAIPLWDGGPGPLAWSGSASVPWLTLAPASGTIPDENSTAYASLIASAKSLSAGDYFGLVTIVYTAGGDTTPTTFTIHLRVN
jgi:hypothetical protein